MHDRAIIAGGLVLFLVGITFPVWYNVVMRTAAGAPAVPRPAAATSCVAPRDFMRTSHMSLLVSWREDVVRRGQRQWTASDGRHYEKSLVRTCLKCHGSKVDFCDRCHVYAGVSPACTDCHVEAAGATR